MPRLLAVGHVTWDRAPGGRVLGGSVSYAALAAQRLGWEAAVLTSAGDDFDPGRDLPGVATFVSWGPATTRFRNEYGADGARRQVLEARARPIDLDPLPAAWRDPDVLLLAPVAGEIPQAGLALAFSAEVVGAVAQGFVRAFGAGGEVSPCAWAEPDRALQGVHALVLSEHDLPAGEDPAALLRFVPIVAVTRGWRGVTLLERGSARPVPTLPRPEVDPTGAGDVFATAFLMRYQETGDPQEAAAFGGCAASCVVEGVGASSLGDRAEVERRLALRERWLEEGELDE